MENIDIFPTRLSTFLFDALTRLYRVVVETLSLDQAAWVLALPLVSWVILDRLQLSVPGLLSLWNGDNSYVCHGLLEYSKQ